MALGVCWRLLAPPPGGVPALRSPLQGELESPPAEQSPARKANVPYKLALFRGGGRLCQLWFSSSPRVSRLPQPRRLKRVLPVVGLLGELKSCWHRVSRHLSGVCGWLADGYRSTRSLGGVLSSVSAFPVLTGDCNPPPGGRMSPGVAVERPDR